MITLREALINNTNITNAKVSSTSRAALDPSDPKNWCIGDVIYITYNYNACIPVFYKINRLIGKITFEIEEVEKKLVSGSYNNPAGYAVVPDITKPIPNIKKVRISKGYVKIDGNFARKWDGKPVEGWSD